MFDAIIGAAGRGVGMALDAKARSDDRHMQENQAAANRQAQYDFAQNGIKWRVADAQASGIHPLYALGANTTSFSPVSVGSSGSTSYSSDLASMGQDIGRAVNATRSQGERTDAFTSSMQAAQLEGARLDNDIKRASLASSVARLRQQQNPPLPKPNADLVPKADDFEDRPRLALGAGEMATDPGYANAEDFEKRYGDVAQELAGVANMWADYQKNYKDGESPLNRRIREFVYDNFRVPGKKGDRWDMRMRRRFFGPY